MEERKIITKKRAIPSLMLIGIIVVSYIIFGNRTPNTTTQKSALVWNAETASFKEYASYGEWEKEEDIERIRELEEYNKATKGTVVEQVQNVDIPSYYKENELAQLQNGEIEVIGQKNNDFPESVFLWSASLEENVSSFAIGDFNKDGLDDVAHIVGYTGGGSGYFYHLIIFVNDKGKLKYLTHKELGDRIVIRSVKYNSGFFIIDMITQGEGDDFKGYCCPNVPTTIKFELENNKLTEVQT